MRQSQLFVVIIFGFLSLSLQAQTNWFSFDIPPLDTSKVEFYPIFDKQPITNGSFVSVNSEGHFEVNGEQIRFWGTPISKNESAALDKKDYPILIEEFRKNGDNLLRFHLWDSEYFNPGTTIFGSGPGTRTLDPDALDRLDYLISLMKENGIYAYIDLYDDRHYTSEDGVYSPDSTYKAAKIVNFFDPKLIALQKEYAKELLTHVSPYTQNALINEPTMAVMDIVNEGWFFLSMRSDQLMPVSKGGLLSQYHFNMLTKLWNDFLITKYQTTDGIRNAWGLPIADTTEQIQNGSFENESTNWGFWGSSNFTTEITTNTAHTGLNSFHVNTPSASANNYDSQLQYSTSFFKNGSTYKLKFWAKSDIAQSISFFIQLDHDPYTQFASGDFDVSGDWKEYSATFTINTSETPKLYFNLGLVNGNLWIDDVSVHGMSDANEKFTLIPYAPLYSSPQKNDQAEFYIKIQNDYFKEMSQYLKNDLGVKIPITGSNYMSGIPDIYVQKNTDFIDNHGYWASWTTSAPVSMIPHPGYFNPILKTLTFSRVPGKPLSVGEYNYGSPNEFAYEGLFFLAAYGSFHAADIMIVHQLEYTQPWDFWNHGLNSYQEISYRALQPTFAYAYRNKLISEADQSVTISFTHDDILKNTVKSDPWKVDLNPDDYPFKLGYQHQLNVDFTSGTSYNRASYPDTPTNPYITDNGQIKWDSTGLLSIGTPQLCGVLGKLDQFKNETIGSIQLIDADKSAGFTLLSLDKKDLVNSEKMLLTLVTKMINTGMVINGWGDVQYGSKPRIVEATTITFNLSSKLDHLKVIWLDESGQPSEYFEIFDNNGAGQIPITINTYDHPGVWFGVEKFEVNAPIAAFTAAPTSGNVPLTVKFTDQSTDATSWSWDFDGDGKMDSQVQNPEFIYENKGSYNVTLTVSNSTGDNTITKSGYIQVSENNPGVDVVFRVDMQMETIDTKGVYLNGSFSNWETPVQMMSQGSIYTTSVNLNKGDQIIYKFMNGDTYEEIQGNCTVDEFKNRSLTVPDTNDTLDVVCFNSCSGCVITSANQFTKNINIYPNPTKGAVTVTGLPNNEEIAISVFDNTGKLLLHQKTKSSTSILDINRLEPGLYIISISGEHTNKIQRILKM